MSGRQPISATHIRSWWPLVAAVLLAIGPILHAQEALRVSMAGDLAAASRKQEANTLGYYNLLTGPVAWRFLSGVEMDFNDNVRSQSQNSRAIWSFIRTRRSR